MMRQAVPLQLMKVHGEGNIHLLPVEEPHSVADGSLNMAVTLWEAGAGAVDTRRERNLCWSRYKSSPYIWTETTGIALVILESTLKDRCLLSKISDDTKLGGVVNTPEGCASEEPQHVAEMGREEPTKVQRRTPFVIPVLFNVFINDLEQDWKEY
ncbi:hypothetical protein BTVI_109669 [Pitangus sulphuratus]|nr:hypothetical protein BTVI_109669 [Pitangus sulphuratus]